MTTQTPISTTSGLFGQTHILFPVTSLQPYSQIVPTSALLSSHLQLFDGTEYRYGPEQLLIVIKTCTFNQLGPEPISPEQKHIWHVRRMVSVATSLDGPPLMAHGF